VACSLPWTIDGQEEVEVAYTIARDFWGQGLGTEAAQAIVQYAFEQLKFSRLVCMIEPENWASVKVAKKIGMTFEKAMEDEMGPYYLYSRSKGLLGILGHQRFTRLCSYQPFLLTW
jgi:RimJ/RimL family protein N-acetyltransferase